MENRNSVTLRCRDKKCSHNLDGFCTGADIEEIESTPLTYRVAVSMPCRVVKGWEWPIAARKAHYFTAGISLCKKWTYDGEPIPIEDWGPPDKPEECQRCRRLLDAMIRDKEEAGR